MSYNYIDSRSGWNAVYGYEHTNGTEATNLNKRFGIVDSVKMDITGNNLSSKSIYSNLNQYNKIVKQSYRITITGKLTNAELFYHALGLELVTGSGPYSHRLTHKNKLNSISMKVFHEETDGLRTFLGCIMDKLEVTWNEGAEVMFSAEYVGLSFIHSETDTIPTSNFDELPYFADNLTEIMINGVNRVADVTAGKIMFNRSTLPYHGSGSNTPVFVKPNAAEYGFELTFYQKNYAMQALFLANTSFAASIKLIVNTTNDFEITYPYVKISAPDSHIQNTDVIMENPKFHVARNDGDIADVPNPDDPPVIYVENICKVVAKDETVRYLPNFV